MAQTYLTDIDLQQNALQNARLQNLGSPPASPVAGQVYYDTTDATAYVWDGAAWRGLVAGQCALYQLRVPLYTAPDEITTGGWQAVGVDEIENFIPGASETGSAVTLPAGRYRARYWVAAAAQLYADQLSVQCRLYDGTAGVAGSGGRYASASEGGVVLVPGEVEARGSCVLTPASTTTYTLQVYATCAATVHYGTNAQFDEQVVAELEIIRL